MQKLFEFYKNNKTSIALATCYTALAVLAFYARDEICSTNHQDSQKPQTEHVITIKSNNLQL